MLRAKTLISLAPARAGLFRRAANFVAAAVLRRKERMALARLDDHMLRDIGLAPDEAQQECQKPYWRN